MLISSFLCDAGTTSELQRVIFSFSLWVKVAETSSFLGSSFQIICGRYRLGAYKTLYNCICNKLVVVMSLLVLVSLLLLLVVVVTVVDVDMIVVVLVVAMVVVVSQSPDLGGKLI